MSAGDTPSLRALATGVALLAGVSLVVSLTSRRMEDFAHNLLPEHFHGPRPRASPPPDAMPRAADFPPGFVFGTATAAYQIEGAARDGGRRPSIWDTFSETLGKTDNGDTGRVACDHYHRYREDVRLLEDLGVSAYRFSIAWPRILPDGVGGGVNEEGVRFYDALLDALHDARITPVATLYHWDLPQAVHDETGGWASEEGRVADEFEAFARVCFERFGGRVKRWITLNEPWCSALLGYDTGEHAPGKSDNRAVDPYRAAHNLLRAHGKAVALYRREFRDKQDGVIGITLNSDWGVPKDESAGAKEASERYMSFNLGWFADPVYKGDYPAVMREAVGDRLPTFSAEEKEQLKGSNDFFGLNHYSSHVVSLTPSADGKSFWQDMGVKSESNETWPRTDMGWSVVPSGFRALLNYIQERYAPPGGIYVTENGLAAREPTLADALADTSRISFYKDYLRAVADAIKDGVDVRGYFLWSLMDNFEWAFGYLKRFGLYYVDYRTQKRSPKPAVAWYRDVIDTKTLPA